MAGMCWGGRYAIRAGLGSNAIETDEGMKPLVDAVVALHPSNLVLLDDVRDVVVPVSIGWGVRDSVVSYKMKGQVEEIHTQRREKGESLPDIEYKTYTPGRHGFSVRGNPDDPKGRKCLEESVTQVLDWSRKYI